MRVYIPSMKRASQIGSRVMTHTYIKEATYVVPEDEVRRYDASLGFQGGKYEIVGCNAVGIAATRHWIGKLAKKRGEPSFCMMDDDLRFARRISDKGIALTDCNKDDVAAMLAWIMNKLRGEYAHASVVARDKNHAVPYMACGDPQTLWQENKRTLRVLAYKTDAFLAMKHGRVDVMEDFDVNLQLLRAGYRNVLTYYWTNDQKETGTKGGCSEYRTKELHEASARKLHELHSGFTKLRIKESKNKGLSEEARKLASRLEVTVDWEGAFESSGNVTRRSPAYEAWVKAGRPAA